MENQRNSRKKLNALILLVAFTAVMLIVSTYAWFSTQRNVVLSGLKGAVNVAEGLQISLDAKHWVNSIKFDDFIQTDSTAWTVKNTVTTAYLDDGKTFQAPADGVTNVVPTEYLPVSTTATTNEGIGKTGLQMYWGTYTDSEGLKDVQLMNEEPASGYFAFDLYLMNTSATGTVSDRLQLDANSDVLGTNEATGIQNTVRVAIALYENGQAPDTGDHPMKIGQTTEPTQAQIIAGTSTGKNISDVAIWEPNADEHVAQIVNTNNKLKLSSDDNTKYELSVGGNGISAFANGKLLPTYGLTASSVAKTLTDVYDWATPAEGLAVQRTTQTKAVDETRTGAIDLYSVKDGTTAIQMIANQYQKARVYVWIEGQDPDCINYASLGQGLTLNLGLSKPENT